MSVASETSVISSLTFSWRGITGTIPVVPDGFHFRCQSPVVKLSTETVLRTKNENKSLKATKNTILQINPILPYVPSTSLVKPKESSYGLDGLILLFAPAS
jgi:hypothetical protein